MLALSFATYGLVKKHVGSRSARSPSLTTETVLLFPFARRRTSSGCEVTGAAHFTSDGAGHALLLASTGVVTAVPLLLFAAAARRRPAVDAWGCCSSSPRCCSCSAASLLLDEHVPALALGRLRPGLARAGRAQRRLAARRRTPSGSRVPPRTPRV